MNSSKGVPEIFQECREAKRAAFIPFLVAGYPDFAVSREAVTAAAQSGADLVEIGIPYSDPLADGPTIARASHHALESGMTFDRALELAEACARHTPQVGFVGFSYYNPLLQRGLERTARDCAAAGLCGIVVPDLPVAEAQLLREVFTAQGLAVIFLVAPTTPPQRAADIAAQSSGFVYVVSRMGITGAQERVAENLTDRLALLRSLTDKPLAVGFGIGSAETARMVARHADGVIVGSALIDRMEAASCGEEAVASVRTMCLEFAAACLRT